MNRNGKLRLSLGLTAEKNEQKEQINTVVHRNQMELRNEYEK